MQHVKCAITSFQSFLSHTLTHFHRREGFTALHAAAKSAHLHVVQFLVSEGADVNAVALER
jgi:ankyrin repeat protein